MTRYVALLGSINVGGNRLKMADLVAALESNGFSNVATVVASGNVLFDHPSEDQGALAEDIASVVKYSFGIDSFAAVRTKAELAASVAENPFANDGEEKFVHVHFLTGQPSGEHFASLAEDHAGRGAERLAPGSLALHIDYVDGVGNSKLTSAFIEKRLGCKGTARNIRSIKRIIEKFD